MPTDRAAAVVWARRQAERVLAGAFDGEPLGVFNAAERVQAVLYQWQWLDDGFPPSIVRFVEGWNASSPSVDQEIRVAAKALVSDTAPNGPPLTGSYGDALIDADAVADR